MIERNRFQSAVSGKSKSHPRNDVEVELVQRVASKDKTAFEQMYQSYHARLARFIAPVVRDCSAVDLEEIINDTLFVVWLRAADFRGDSKVSTWIFGIAYRIALSERKKLLAKSALHDDIEPDEVSAHCSYQQQLGTKNWVETAMQKLSVEHQTVVRLTYWEGLSYQEIAEAMDCPVNTVKTRMHYARNKLKKSLTHSLDPQGFKTSDSDILASLDEIL